MPKFPSSALRPHFPTRSEEQAQRSLSLAGHGALCLFLSQSKFIEMIFRVSQLARARSAVAARRLASSEVATTSPAGAGMNAFAKGWYNVYVRPA